MKTSQYVLELLEQNRGKAVSGEELAAAIGVSRNAVWKAIEELRRSGVKINAKTKTGYFLPESDNSLSKEGITALLGDERFTVDVRHTVTSTNDLLKQLAVTGTPEGYALIAAEQTMGKGRFGRKFYSPDGSGVYISLLLRPKMKAEDSLFITTSAAVAVCRAVETISGGRLSPKIKWVNDIYINQKKVCGILTEAAVSFESGMLDYAVLGIGINITTPEGDFPEEIKGIATSLFGGTEQDNIRNRIAAEVLKELGGLIDAPDDKACLEEYKQRQLLIDRDIVVIKGDKRIFARALGVDERARLCVRYEDGSTEALISGEVSVRAAGN
ncbi:biotin--[acetyl-CoA-carboxylase] ligase [Ruminococcus sp. NK3A76]|uniref:biotin--[acetyl-CoA-carboxylase] ligase n=1 Tax=Ruminococcus sp. NK3A76 TaxID=877411 RepID=UPI00048A9C59|nr:biotin--[acetyl-CoA-carboxylase] ligase [Ruminococcus sp. NK3A76]